MIWGETTEEMLTRVFGKHKWFAWRPVRLNNDRWIWWEYVWRQRISGRGADWNEYDLIKKGEGDD